MRWEQKGRLEQSVKDERHRVGLWRDQQRGVREPIIVYTLHTPFIHLHVPYLHLCTPVIHVYTHHIYTLCTPNAPLYTLYTRLNAPSLHTVYTGTRGSF